MCYDTCVFSVLLLGWERLGRRPLNQPTFGHPVRPCRSLPVFCQTRNGLLTWFVSLSARFLGVHSFQVQRTSSLRKAILANSALPRYQFGRMISAPQNGTSMAWKCRTFGLRCLSPTNGLMLSFQESCSALALATFEQATVHYQFTRPIFNLICNLRRGASFSGLGA